MLIDNLHTNFPQCTSSIFLKLNIRLSLGLKNKTGGSYIPQVHYPDRYIWGRGGEGGGKGWGDIYIRF